MRTHGARPDFSPPRVGLTPRDVAVLCDLLRCGALSAEQVRRRHFPATAPGGKTALNRLRKLRLAGYVRTVPVGPDRHGAYVATAKGARAADCGLAAPRLWAGARHAVAAADVADALLALRYQGGEASWRTERELAAEHAGTGVWPYRPDGLLVLTGADGAAHAMAVEVELGAKQPRRYAPKVAWYRERLASGALRRVRWYCAGTATLRAVQRATAGLPAGGAEVVPLPM